jgi:hypothetical protein
MGNCLPKKKKRMNIDEAITYLEEALNVRLQARNAAQTSVEEIQKEIQATRAQVPSDESNLLVLYARQQLAKEQLATATLHLIDSERRLALVKETKTNSTAQAITLKAYPHLTHTGTTADKENQQDSRMDDLLDYTTTLSQDASLATSELMAKASEEMKKHNTEQQQQQENTVSIDQMVELPPTSYREPLRSSGSTDKGKYQAVYSTV